MLNIDRMLIAQMAKIILRFPPSDKKILPPPPEKFPVPPTGQEFPSTSTIYGKPRSFWPIFFAEVT